VSDEAYALSLAPSVRRVLAQGPPRGLPIAVAAAVTRFWIADLLENPQRVGQPLARELSGYHCARRGAYRVVYRIDDAERVVHVVRIDHGAGVYRTS
jgi:mRNA interferase RelE/StbE